MNNVVMDTLRFANRLRDEGIEPAQAEGFARVLGDELAEHLLTKQDVDTALVPLRNSIDALRGDFEEYKTEVDTRFDGFGQRLDSFGQRLDSFGQRLDSFGQRLDSFEERQDTFAKQEVVDARFEALEAKLTALGDKVDVQGRYAFLIMTLLVALGVYNAVSPQLIRSQQVAAPVPATTGPAREATPPTNAPAP